MSLRNRVVDAGDEEKVDGEWRMPPKVDIVESSSSRQARRYGETGVTSGTAALRFSVIPEATSDLHRRQAQIVLETQLRYRVFCAAPFKSPLVLF